MSEVRAYAPGRVNLIGEHTDYVGGLALPMAIDLGTTVVANRCEDHVVLRSAQFPGVTDIALDISDPTTVEPSWGRYVAGVVSVLRPSRGIDGHISTTIPVGTGLSSSAALEVAVALALGASANTLDLARQCQQAEQIASGVPCGLMDQLTSAGGREGHALMIDFRNLQVSPIPVPEQVEIVVVHSGQARELATSAYALRRSQLEAAQHLIGPLRDAKLVDVDTIADPTIAARARHVVSENQRVREFADAFASGDIQRAGHIMNDAHVSFRDDFEASTPTVDQLVERLSAQPGVYGVRLTGGGFGGCVVALTKPGTLSQGWVVRASRGAWIDGPAMI
ncbi:MAG: galactokinase [Actinomycetes bacterium]